MKDIRELLGIEYPIIQGGMAHISDSNLAASVSNAGGLGVIASGSNDSDTILKEIRKTKEMTDKPFGINIMMLNPDVDNIVKMLIKEKPKAVITGAGNPGKYISSLKEASIKVIPVVANVSLAIRLEKAGADALVAEGCEAGGHIGELTTFSLVPQVVDAVSLPVVAAGGIADSRGVKAAFMLGAKGVQVGTAFLVADETNIHDNYKEMVLKAGDSSTIITGRTTGHPVRSLKNIGARKILKLEKEGISPEEFEAQMAGTLRKAAVLGDVENGSVMSGQIAGMIKKRGTVKEIIEHIFDGVSLN